MAHCSSDRTEPVMLWPAENGSAASVQAAANGLFLRIVRARVLKASRSRPILRYIVTASNGEHSNGGERVILGKAYHRGDGAMAFHVLSQLWADGFSHNRLTIPEPVGYVSDINLLLQTPAPGRPLYMHLDAPARGLKLVRRTARWLAKFHKASMIDVPVHQLQEEERKLGVYRDGLVQNCPQFATRLEDLAGRVLAAIKSLYPWQAVPTHGDFQPKNIYVRSSQVTVIDFDCFALAPAARDLGHFIGQCQTMSYVRCGNFGEIAPWNIAFLAEYVRSTSPDVLPTLPAYVARTFFEVLYYKLVVRPVKDPSFLPVWLDECERWLSFPPHDFLAGTGDAERKGRTADCRGRLVKQDVPFAAGIQADPLAS